MFHSLSLCDLLKKLENSNRTEKISILKELSKLIHLATPYEINRLTSFMLRINDVEIILKIFFILGVSITKDEYFKSIFTKNTAVYNKAFNILSKGLFIKTIAILNYFTALTYKEKEDSEDECSAKSNIVGFAQNMVRSSGCFGLLMQFFMGDTVCADLWRPLCMCITECCRRQTQNQNQASHLLPKCLQLIKNDVDEVLLSLIQALLDNNLENKERFLKFNGHTVLTREVLNTIPGLQLLCTLLEDCNTAVELAQNAQVNDLLIELMQEESIDDKMRQWCMLCYYRLTSGPCTDTSINNNLHKQDILLYYRNAKNKKHINHMVNDENLLPELNYQQPHVPPLQTYRNKFEAVSLSSLHQTSTIQNPNVTRNHKKQIYSNSILQSYIDNVANEKNRHLSEISLSRNLNTIVNDSKVTLNSGTEFGKLNLNTKADQSCQTSFEDTSPKFNETNFKKSTLNSTLFYPMITSTPQRHDTSNQFKPFQSASNRSSFASHRQKHSENMLNSFNTKMRNKHLSKKHKNLNGVRRSINSVSDTMNEEINKTIDHNTSIQSKLFTSLHNITNTSFFKTMKSFIMPDSNKNISRVSKAKQKQCSKQILHRSNVINKNTTRYHSTGKENRISDSSCSSRSDEISDSVASNKTLCRTCDSTVMLKRKFADNKYLRETVKKLKVGVSLYGCNFKKIAQKLWPDDRYITSAVLFNLYKKIIVKKN